MKTTTSNVIWHPTGEYLKCRVADFIKLHGLRDWQQLITRSMRDTEWFWQAAVEYMGFQWSRPYEKLLDESAGFAWAKWFVGGQLNIAENCLDWHMMAGKTAGARTSVGKDHPALIWEGEEGAGRKLTYGE